MPVIVFGTKSSKYAIALHVPAGGGRAHSERAKHAAVSGAEAGPHLVHNEGGRLREETQGYAGKHPQLLMQVHTSSSLAAFTPCAFDCH
eukprot:scaffold116110_cov50-Prasinocladus_malaysianus.AAC.1